MDADRADDSELDPEELEDEFEDDDLADVDELDDVDGDDEDDDFDDDDDFDEDDDDEDDDEDEEVEEGVGAGGSVSAGAGALETASELETDYEPGDVNTVAAPAAERDEQRSGRSESAVEVLSYLAAAMADEPDAVVVRRESRRGSTVLRLHVAPGDMGRVIGRRGRTAQAIRTLVGVAGARDGVQTLVDIVDD